VSGPPSTAARRSALATAALVAALVASASLAQGAGDYLDPPAHQPGLGDFGDRIVFELAPRTTTPSEESAASPLARSYLWLLRPDFELQPPWSTEITVDTGSGDLWRITLLDHANVAVNVDWITEQLVLVRVWWGRVVEAELLLAVDVRELVHAATYHHFGAASGSR